MNTDCETDGSFYRTKIYLLSNYVGVVYNASCAQVLSTLGRVWRAARDKVVAAYHWVVKQLPCCAGDSPYSQFTNATSIDM